MAFGPLPTSIQNFLTWQARTYAERGDQPSGGGPQPGPFVTLSRAFGCEGMPFAQGLADRLNAISAAPTPWVVMGKEIINTITERRGEAGRFVEALAQGRRSFMQQTVEVLLGHKPTEYQAYQALAETLLTLAEAGRVILVGRGGAIVCGGAARGYHVRLVAPLSWRANKLAQSHGLGVAETETLAAREELARDAFVRDFAGADATEPEHYDAVFNNARHTVGEMADLVVAALRAKGYV